MTGNRTPPRCRSATSTVRRSATAREAVELCRELRPRVTIPVHYEGWKHFREGRDAIERAFAAAPDAVRASVRWLPIGEAVDIAGDRAKPA